MGNRLREIRKSKGLTLQKLADLVGTSLQQVSRLERSDRKLTQEWMEAFGKAMEVPPSAFFPTAMDATTIHRDGRLRSISIENVMIRGVVQAGLWSPATEWEPDDWYPLAVPTDPRYPGARRFGLEVRGNSMNLVYPPGTVVIAVSFFEIDQQPRDQQHVVVVRRNSSGEFEATLKQFRIDEQGRCILWPRSTDPEHQAPIILPPSLGLSEDQDGFMIPGYSPPDTHGAGVTDLEITALVIGSFRPE